MRRLYLTLLLVCLLLAVPGHALADTSNFVVNDFTADYTPSQDDRQGSLAVNEYIAVNFNDYNHGILRALPKKYDGNSLELKVGSVQQDGAKQQYTTYTSNGNEVLQIGDPDKTITGAHTYDISYQVSNVIHFDNAADVLSWNVNGTQWSQPFDHVTARLHLPPAQLAKFTDAACYTGRQGSTGHDCTFQTIGDTVTFTTTRRLDAGENLTIYGHFPTGTFQKPSLADRVREKLLPFLPAILLPLAAFIPAYWYWRRNGKDLKGRGTIIPEYAPPDGLRPAEADTLLHYKLGQDAISATIIDLAIRGYLRISEATAPGLLGIGKHKVYTLEKLTAPAADTLKPYEMVIYAGLFPSGDVTQISDLRASFYLTATSVQKDIPLSLTSGGYFAKNPYSWRGGPLVAVIPATIFSCIFFGTHPAVVVGLVLAVVVLGIFRYLMPKRTAKGVQALDDLRGLKLYIETAEKDRIKMLQSPDAPYAPISDAPVKTVELFEKLLPYAMVFGVEQQWAKQFEGIYTSAPDWYAGNWSGANGIGSFSAGYLASNLSLATAAMNSSFAAPSSSGSGSGGGGFSGGGGGGGGGGGW